MTALALAFLGAVFGVAALAVFIVRRRATLLRRERRAFYVTGQANGKTDHMGRYFREQWARTPITLTTSTNAPLTWMQREHFSRRRAELEVPATPVYGLCDGQCVTDGNRRVVRVKGRRDKAKSAYCGVCGRPIPLAVLQGGLAEAALS